MLFNLRETLLAKLRDPLHVGEWPLRPEAVSPGQPPSRTQNANPRASMNEFGSV